MPLKYGIFGYVLFICSLIFIFFFNTKPTEKIVELRKEIHRIHSTRIIQTRETDKKIDTIKKNSTRRITNLKQLTDSQVVKLFDNEIPKTDSSDSTEQLKKCLEYKFSYERDSASLQIMTEDRDSCNEQLGRIVEKADSVVIKSLTESDKKYKQGLKHGIFGGIVTCLIAAITFVMIAK